VTLDHPVRSGLCHGPSCEQKITEKSESRYFCSQACQARWQAAHVGVPPDPALLATQRVYRVVGSGPCAPPVRPMPPERIEALRPLDLSLGARHHLTGGEYVVTESEPGRAVLTPIEEADDTIGELIRSMVAQGAIREESFQFSPRPKPIRKSWWKPNTWRRNG
jgi:endogenous inhibitor of DNA gyrase (YacG/DUF329 family)